MSLRLSTRPQLRVPPKGEHYDVLIVGAGPAGLSAAIYASRFLLKSAVVSEDVGGQLNLTNVVDDYPATLSISATELISKFREHAEKLFGVPIYTNITVEKFVKEGDEYHVTGTRGLDVYSKTIVLAVGSRRRKLGVPGEKEFTGRGVSYCSICDAPLYKGRDAVAVVGGGDAAFEGAILLSGYVKKVYLIHRRSEFRAKPFYVEEAMSRPNIEFVLNSVVTEIHGDKTVTDVVVKNNVDGSTRKLKVDGIFIEIGFEPPKDWYQSLGLEVDDLGYVKTDMWMRTNLPGVFAAGDAISLWRGFRQIVNAAASGAIAAYSAYTYLTERGLVRRPAPSKAEEGVKELGNTA